MAWCQLFVRGVPNVGSYNSAHAEVPAWAVTPVRPSVACSLMLIWLQGGPSTGKSSIAGKMLAASTTGEAWFHTGDDHVIARVPRRLIAPRGSGNAPIDGWDIPVEGRILLGRPRAGPVAMRILDGMYQAAAAMASAGVHVIVDDVVWERPVAELARRAMRDVPHVIVEVDCDVAVALERGHNVPIGTGGPWPPTPASRHWWSNRISDSTPPVEPLTSAPLSSSDSSGASSRVTHPSDRARRSAPTASSLAPKRRRRSIHRQLLSVRSGSSQRADRPVDARHPTAPQRLSAPPNVQPPVCHRAIGGVAYSGSAYSLVRGGQVRARRAA